MTSHYSSDPRVPPARVGHIGKPTHGTERGTDGLPVLPPALGEVRDPGPTYDDFLEHEGDDESTDRTG